MVLFDFTKNVSSEIVVIYGLIALVVVLIAVIVILDKKEKKKINLTKTQELRLMDLRRADDNYIEEFKIVERNEEEIETTELKQDVAVKVPPKVAKVVKIQAHDDTLVIDDTMYVEDDLEKTSAQLNLEALATELKKVQENEVDKISRFEAEQEENAIISYNELLKVSSKLYNENEKVQYSDEGDEPITIDQLRKRFEKPSNYNDNVEVL